MSKEFFDLRTPRDMLAKAQRELAKLESKLDIDNVFNFFVTAYHVRDYLEIQFPALQGDLKNLFENDSDLNLCNFICNKGKHLELRPSKTGTPRDKTARVHRRPPSIPGAFIPGLSIPGAGALTVFYVNGVEVDVRSLARRIVDKWQAFFQTHSIP